jgi:hypothetical protein
VVVSVSANLWLSYTTLLDTGSTAGTSTMDMLTFDHTLSRVRVDLAATITTPLPATADLGGETDGSGWAASFGSVARSTVQAHTGFGSILLTPNAGGASVARTLSANSPTVQAGQQYTETVWVYSPAGWSTVQAVLAWIDSGGTNLSSSNGTAVAVTAGGWTKLTVTGTAPTNAVHASLRVQMNGTPAATDLLYVDDMQLTYAFPIASTWTVQRSTDLIRWTTIRGGSAITVDANVLPVDDYEFAADVQNTYRVQVYDSTSALLWTFTDAITPTLGLASSQVWLKDLGAPYLNQIVTVSSAGDITRASRTGTFDIVGSAFPVAVTDVRAGRAYQLTLATETTTDDTNLDALLATGDVLYLHAPTGFPLPSGYYAVGDTTRTWQELTPAQNPARWTALPLTEVAAPAADVVGGTATWTAVVSSYATWDDVVAAADTWNDLVDSIADSGGTITN